jgi:predicted ATPase
LLGFLTFAKSPQKAESSSAFLESDLSNLCLLLNQIKLNRNSEKEFLDSLNKLNIRTTGYEIIVERGSLRLYALEGRFAIPATKLSDGTLRFFSLLAVLCHPSPPPIVCIEEPEVGLHPEILLTVAKLIKNASSRCQLIITTHSDILLDSLTNYSESVILTENPYTKNYTLLKTLDVDRIKPDLEEEGLGGLWLSGQIGGVRK